MLLTRIIAGAAASVVAAAVLAGPADAAPSAPTAAATVAQQTAAGSHVAARKRVRTQVGVAITPSGTAFYDIAGTLTSRGAPVPGKKLMLQFKGKHGWKKAYAVARTDAAGTVHYYGVSRKVGLTYRLSFPGAKRFKASHSVRFLVDPR